jgi:hypothetical protein
VHGDAALLELNGAEHAAFRDYCFEVYVPLYGERWIRFIESPDIFYARIDASHMFTYRKDPSS